MLRRLNKPKYKVTFLKTSGLHLAAVVAMQGLLVERSSHSCLKMAFLKEHGVVFALLLLLELIVSEHPWQSINESTLR